MFDFSGRVAMVTGANGVLGSAVARAFLAAGARVVLVDHAPARLSARFPELADSSDHLLAEGIDVTDPDAVQETVAIARTRLGRLDVLANTVGGYRAGAPVHEAPPAVWEAMLALNLRSALVPCRAVIPVMLSQGYGKIINVAARQGLSGGANAAAYSASKSAVIRLTESLAAELRGQGINANCILPSIIDTPRNREEMPKADTSRWVSPEAAADVILFLASDAARAVNGAAVPV